MTLNYLFYIKISFSITCIIIFHEASGQLWPKIYGNNIHAYGENIIEGYDKGYFLCGSILRNASKFKYGWLIKSDLNGNLIWDKKFGDPSVENFFLDFDKTSDNGLVLSGGTAQEDIERDPLFIKLDPSGDIEWCKIFLSPHDNTAPGVISLPDGSFIGMLQYYGGNAQEIRISLVKMDVTGEPIWIKHLAQEDTTISNEEGNELAFTPDCNLLITGSCFSPYLKPFFIKTDTAGMELWDIKWPVGYEGYAKQSDFSSSGIIYSVTGLTFNGQPKIPYLLKFDGNGEVIDQYPLMGDTIVRGGAESLLLVADTTLFVGLTWTDDPTYNDAYTDLMKTDTLGNLITQRHLVNDYFPPTRIIESFDGKILAVGTNFIDGNFDILLWKMNSNLADDTLYTQPFTYDSLCPYQITSDTVDLDCGLFVNIDEIPTKEEYESTIKISPNPAREWISMTFSDILAAGEVQLVVYNIFGQEVLNKISVPTNRIASLDISSLSRGIYFVRSRDKRSRTYTGKFVVGR